ncbi:MAG: hypothetical protein RMA76_21475 [Deltaproteobacteria bacterium]|jgi:hypothetical protein
MSVAWLALLAATAPQIAVFPVVKASFGEVTADGVHERVEATVAARAGVSVMSRTTFLTTPRDVVNRLRDCALEAECLAREARNFSARYLVVVIANTTVQPPIVGTLLIDVDEQKLVHRAVGGKEGAPLDRIALQVDEALDRAHFVRLSRLSIRADPADATVRLVPAVRRDVDGTFWVNPGEVQIEVQRKGYEPDRRALQLAPGESQTLEVRLQEASSVLASPWLWIGVGAAVAASVGAAVVITQSGAGVDCACVGEGMCPPGC